MYARDHNGTYIVLGRNNTNWNLKLSYYDSVTIQQSELKANEKHRKPSKTDSGERAHMNVPSIFLFLGLLLHLLAIVVVAVEVSRLCCKQRKINYYGISLKVRTYLCSYIL